MTSAPIRIYSTNRHRSVNSTNEPKVQFADFPYSGPTEIEPFGAEQLTATDEGIWAVANPAVSPSLREALAECRRKSSSQLLLPSWRAKVASFGPPYRLYREMLAGGVSAVRHVLDDDYFKHRDRSPSVKKVALIAIEIFVRPATDDLSACSDYACVLEHAHAEHVPPDSLVEWLLNTGFNACKDAVRAKRKAEKLARTDPPKVVEALPAPGEGVLEVVQASSLDVTSRDTEQGPERVVKFHSAFGRLELSAPVEHAAKLPKLLRQIADRLEKSTVLQIGE
ncbi:MAG: hypothetical protein EOR00_24270 [Mesorhizobium sp.]|uniref:hypothetical protein n=1 Tax=Mesorhizobium sp. TaxID=1871066 RepID=UPI000FE9886B|nr:hypothetical protein [Mesorhizobium sp.]RWP13958.1 MAG: hypothetical protein EOR00_24270 [Mesorhizobium sp.]